MLYLPICPPHRVTSGLVVLAKSKEAASSISKEIRDKSTKKTYLARVKGKFPLNLGKFQIVNIDEILNVTIEDDGTDDNEEDKNEKKKTTDRGNNLDKKSQNKMNDRQAKEQHMIREQQQQLGKKRDRNGTQKTIEINESDLPPRVRDVPTFEEVVSSDRVRCSIDVATGDVTLRCPIGTILSDLTDK
jgi:RNA pseudouridylate synthase